MVSVSVCNYFWQEKIFSSHAKAQSFAKSAWFCVVCVGWSHTEYTESLRSVMVSRRRRRLSQKYAEQILCHSVIFVCNIYLTKEHNASRPLRLCVNIKYALMFFCLEKLWVNSASFLCFCVQNLNERDTFLSGVIFCNIRKNYWFYQVSCMEKMQCVVSAQIF